MAELSLSERSLLERSGAYVDEGWDALDVPDTEAAGHLAREALSLSPLALDAYLILARIEVVPSVRIALLREAVLQGGHLVGRPPARAGSSGIWHDPGGREWARAMQHLALELWDRNAGDDRAEGAGLLLDLVRRDPADHIGARFLAFGWLPLVDRWDRWSALIRRFRSEQRTATRYSAALDALRRGDASASQFLDNAIALNRHVPAYLLARHRPFPDPGESEQQGSDEEARNYAALAYPVWHQVPSALAWLEARWRPPRR